MRTVFESPRSSLCSRTPERWREISTLYFPLRNVTTAPRWAPQLSMASSRIWRMVFLRSGPRLIWRTTSRMGLSLASVFWSNDSFSRPSSGITLILPGGIRIFPVRDVRTSNRPGASSDPCKAQEQRRLESQEAARAAAASLRAARNGRLPGLAPDRVLDRQGVLLAVDRAVGRRRLLLGQDLPGRRRVLDLEPRPLSRRRRFVGGEDHAVDVRRIQEDDAQVACRIIHPRLDHRDADGVQRDRRRPQCPGRQRPPDGLAAVRRP